MMTDATERMEVQVPAPPDPFGTEPQELFGAKVGANGPTRTVSKTPADHVVLEWMPDAVLVTDRDGVIVFANQQSEDMTGYRRSELVGRHVEVLVPPRLRRQHVNHRRRFYARGAARLMGAPGSDLSLRRKDGSVVMVETRTP